MEETEITVQEITEHAKRRIYQLRRIVEDLQTWKAEPERTKKERKRAARNIRKTWGEIAELFRFFEELDMMNAAELMAILKKAREDERAGNVQQCATMESGGKSCDTVRHEET